MKTCNKCKENLPLDQFFKDSAKPDGLRTICKGCTTDRHKENRKLIKEYQDLWGGCAVCGYNQCDDCIDFHHIQRDNKKKAISKMFSYSKKNLTEELVKTIPLCKICHCQHHTLGDPSSEKLYKLWKSRIGSWGLLDRE